MTAHLAETLQRFIKDTGLVPLMSVEQEFYVAPEAPENLIPRLALACQGAGLDVDGVVEEDGLNQYEVKCNATRDVIGLAKTIIRLRDCISHVAALHHIRALFDAKPFPDQPGSGMHVHISLWDAQGHNVLEKKGEEESDTMLYAVGGLLDAIPASMPIFCPTAAAYARYGSSKNAPCTISWGGNNRTVALRLPTTTLDPHNRRIEHRLPAAECNPFEVFATILNAAREGIRKKTLPSTPKIYGNAFLEQYSLPPIPQPVFEEEQQAG